MKHILFISTMNGAGWGGSEEFWYRLAIYMAGHGYRVECCYFNWPGRKTEKTNALEKAGCTIHLLPNPKLTGTYFERKLMKFRCRVQLKKILSKEYNLVCISQGGMLDVTYPLMNRCFRYLKKFVLVYHNYDEAAKLSATRKRSLYKWSNAALQNMMDAGRILTAANKVAGFQIPNHYVIKNPVTIPVKNKPEPWPGLDENGNYTWIVLAELDISRKSQDVLIKVLSTEKWKQRNWQLYLYGDGQDKSFLADLISSVQADKKIFLMGHTSNVEAVLQQAHLLLQITHIDAMPLSVTEAMNMARPCVVSSTGDMPLWIEDAVNGYVAGAVTESSIDDTMEKAWQQRENWQQLGIKAFEVFQQKYPVHYEAYYESFLAGLMKD